MKKIVVVLALFLFTISPSKSLAQTTITDSLVSGYWTLLGSPYDITGNITIPNDSTLLIEPGVIVNFLDTFKLQVNGRLLALGTATDSISFKANNILVGWAGIRFDSTLATNDTSRISFCKILNSKANGSELDGGGIFINFSPKVIVEHSRISNCSANILNGRGGGIAVINCDPVITNNQINNNNGRKKGGGIFLYNSKSKIDNNLICNNSVKNDGAGICIELGQPIISNNIITNNIVSIIAGGTKRGGGICITGCQNSCFFVNNIVSNNTNNQGDGGGFFVLGDADILNNTINSNSAQTGGGVYLENSTQPVDSNIISFNTATLKGGGIRIIACYSDIVNNKITDNQAGDQGGGLHITMGIDSALMLVKNQITNNISANLGGGVCAFSPVFLQFCNISNNASNDAGGLFLYSSYSINNCILANNTAQTNGGAIYSKNPETQTIINSTIVNNSADNGGALYCTDFNDPEIKNTIIWGNTATTSGSQLFLVDDWSDPTFSYCNVQFGSVGFGVNGWFYLGNYSNTINSTPLFVAPSIGSGNAYNGSSANWSLQAASPCVDAGNPATQTPYKDILENFRVTVCRIDIGACERQTGTPFVMTIIETQPIFCFGSTSGQLTANATGGSGNYSFFWHTNPTQTTSSISGLSSGTYSVTVTELSYGCTINASLFLSQPASLPTFTATKTNNNCNADTTGLINVTAIGGTGPYQYSNDGGITFQLGNLFDSLLAGTYSVVVKDIGNCTTGAQSFTITDPAAIVTSFSSTNVLCNTGSSGSISASAIGGVGPFSYSNNGGSAFQPSSVFLGLTSGTYSLILKDANGCLTAPQSINISQPSTPLIASIVSSIAVSCYGGGNGVAISTVSGGTPPYYYSWSTSPIQNSSTATNLAAGNYTLSATDSNACSTILPVSIASIIPLPTICMATVDSLSTHNIVYWEKPATTLIDSFKIYRQITTNVYLLLASVPYDSLSEYHDYAANPNSTSFTYKISAIDTCGSESIKSDFHSCIHLQNLGFGNLQWTLYAIENTLNPVIFYRICRDDLNTGNFLAISSSIPGSNTTFSDIAFGSYPNANYRVDVTWGISCSPTRTTINTTRSNIRPQTQIGIFESNKKPDEFKVYPNPATQSISLDFLENPDFKTIKIMNVLGEVVIYKTCEKLLNNVLKIDVASLQSGIYYIEVLTENIRLTKKLIVQ